MFGTSKCDGLAGARAGAVAADEVIIRSLRNRIFQMMDSMSLQMCIRDRHSWVALQHGGINVESDNVPVVIVAGGLGTRMKPFSDVLPKPLLMYQDQPMIKNVLDNFSVRGFRHFIILLHHQAQMIRAYLDYINTGWQIDSFYENEPLGTAGGLFLLKEHITDNLIVCNCDNPVSYTHLVANPLTGLVFCADC